MYLLTPIFDIKHERGNIVLIYVNMQYNYMYEEMRLIYVDLRLSNVNMLVNHVYMQFITK